MMASLVFSAEDIFEEIPGDPDNVILKFPPEILEQTGWQPGDSLSVKIENGTIVVTKNE
jgi:formylmethanofuran dehydrogenase subunit D